MKKRVFSMLVVVAVLLTAFSAFSFAGAESTEPVELTIGAQNLGFDGKDYWPDEWFQHVEEVLNVKFTEWYQYDDDTFALALASGDQKDIMMSNKASAVLTASAAVPLDDYLEEYGQNILKYELRNELLRKYMSGGDGKLYFHTPNTGYEDATGAVEGWNGFLVRWDLYEKLGYPEMKSYDDYVEVLEDMVELYPTNENGEKTYALGIWNDSGLWGWVQGQIANMGTTGVGDYNFVWDTKNNTMINHLAETDTSVSPWWQAITFYRELNKRGLLDPDSFAMTNDDLDEKYANNRYVGGICTWYVGEMYTANREKDPNTLAGIMAVPYEGSSGWYGQNAIIGWNGKNLYVSTSCAQEKIPAAVSFIDYLDSDDGNRTHYSGIQGKYWDYGDDGVPALLDAAYEAKTAGGDTLGATGINQYANFIGSSAFGMAEDGYYYDLGLYNLGNGLTPLQQAFADHYGVSYPGELRYNMEQEGKAYSQKVSLHTTIDALCNEVPDEISTITSRVQEMMIRWLQPLITCADDAEFEAQQKQFIEEVKAAGLDTAFEWYNTQWSTLRDEIQAIIDAEAAESTDATATEATESAETAETTDAAEDAETAETTDTTEDAEAAETTEDAEAAEAAE